MLLRFDQRRVCQLVRDDGTEATAAEILTDATLQAMQDDATGLIDSALLVGGRYTEAELEALAGGAEGAAITRLCADLTYGLLVARRGYSAADMSQLAPRYADALSTQQMLRDGDRIFEGLGQEDATKPKRVRLSRDIYLTTSATRHFGTKLDQDLGV